MRSAKIMVGFYFYLFCISLGIVFGQETGFVPHDHPVYSFIEEFRSRGLIGYLPSTRPYSRYQVYATLNDLDSRIKSGDYVINTQDQERLTEFLGLFGNKPGGLISVPWEGGALSIGSPLGLEVLGSIGTIDQGFIQESTQNLQIGVSIGENFWMGIDSQTKAQLYNFQGYPSMPLDYGHFADYYMYTQNLETGLGGFNHTGGYPQGETSITLLQNSTSEAYFSNEFVTFGILRTSLDWGPSPDANLILSKTAKPFDSLYLHIPFAKYGSFSWVLGFLEDVEPGVLRNRSQKLLNAHRIEISPLPGLVLGIHEAIVYSRRFELSYLNPISFYYATEVRNGDYDNKLGGVDAKLYLPPLNSSVYISLFADDWNISKPLDIHYYHNIGAYQAGWNSSNIAGSGLNAELEYTYLSHWMYTHLALTDDNGDLTHNQYSHFLSPLGHPLPPNSHQIRLELSKHWTEEFSTLFHGALIQRSFGDLYRGINSINEDGSKLLWDLNGIYDNLLPFSYAFLDIGKDKAVLETTMELEIQGALKLPTYGIDIHGAYGFDVTWNDDLVKGRTTWSHGFSIGVDFSLQ